MSSRTVRTMEWTLRAIPTRRLILRACLAMPVPLLLASCGGQTVSSVTPAVPTRSAPAPPTPSPPAPTQPPPSPTRPSPTPAASAQLQTTPSPVAQPAPTQVLQPTPACGDDDDPTLAQTEGPYYKPRSPERASLLEPGITGTKMVLTGFVVTTACRPVARALLDFWHADDQGAYDNVGFKLRGHQFTDETGRYSLESIVPGLYPGRTRHFHVKVQAPNQPILTTQLYFPGETQNGADAIFREELVMGVKETGDGKAATFSFVLNVG